MLVNLKDILKVAKENKFAVGAFNTSDLALVRAVVEQAEESNAGHPAVCARRIPICYAVFFPICKRESTRQQNTDSDSSGSRKNHGGLCGSHKSRFYLGHDRRFPSSL